MKAIEEFPESCKQSIKAISERLNTDYETAYAIMCMEAILWDLYPSDKAIVEMVLDSGDNSSEKTKN